MTDDTLGGVFALFTDTIIPNEEQVVGNIISLSSLNHIQESLVLFLSIVGKHPFH